MALVESNFIKECWYPDLYPWIWVSLCRRCLVSSSSGRLAALGADPDQFLARPLPGVGGGGPPGLLIGEDPLPAEAAGMFLSRFTLSIIPAILSGVNACVTFGGIISSSSENMPGSSAFVAPFLVASCLISSWRLIWSAWILSANWADVAMWADLLIWASTRLSSVEVRFALDPGVSVGRTLGAF